MRLPKKKAEAARLAISGKSVRGGRDVCGMNQIVTKMCGFAQAYLDNRKREIQLDV